METDQQILQEIAAAVRAADEEDKHLFAFYERLIGAISAKKTSLSLDKDALFQKEVATALVQEGESHLIFDTLDTAPETFYPWLLEIAAIFEERDPGVVDEMEGIDDSGSIELARRWFEEGITRVGPLVDALIANAMAPYLEKAAEILLPLLPLALWEQSYCPICAGFPDFALWDSNTGNYQLMCERCRATWTWQGGTCAFCGDEASEARGFFSSEDERFRVEVCDTCGHYIKMADLQVWQAGGVQPVAGAERLLTPGLDLFALQEGYTRPTGLGNQAL